VSLTSYAEKVFASSLTRTGDPQLRRLLLYPTELWTRIGMVGFEPTISCSQSGPGIVSRSLAKAHPVSFFLAGEEVILSRALERYQAKSCRVKASSVLHFKATQG
jgi:hypothetical protein